MSRVRSPGRRESFSGFPASPVLTCPQAARLVRFWSSARETLLAAGDAQDRDLGSTTRSNPSAVTDKKEILLLDFEILQILS